MSVNEYIVTARFSSYIAWPLYASMEGHGDRLIANIPSSSDLPCNSPRRKMARFGQFSENLPDFVAAGV